MTRVASALCLFVWASASSVADVAAQSEPARRAVGDIPTGYAGRGKSDGSTAAVEEYLRRYGYESADFTPVPDRWRIGMPAWDRSGGGATRLWGSDAPYQRGHALNPYRQSVLKGDYPVVGDHLFMVLGLVSDTVFEARDLPTPSGISTAGPRRADFFGSGDQVFITSNLALTAEVFSGSTAFKPPDWLARATLVLNGSYLDTDENLAVNIDTREGVTRTDGHVGVQELLFEKHLVDLSANYDFLSITFGIQQFTSDFRGLIFSDNNLGVRASMNLLNNRLQATLAGFYMLEKDTNAELNTFEERDQVVLIATAAYQDFVWRGYTISASVHYNRDNESRHIDRNDVPVRPAILGSARPHRIDAVYVGFAGDGHIGRLNLTHEAFLVFGEDSHNPLAGRAVDLFAQLVFIELSIDYDWLRPRFSLFFASGDDNPTDGTARGFDAILDNPNFAGGANSFWIRQGLRLLGVGLTHRLSALPTLRSSKVEGQANFVNPGLLFLTVGLDAEITTEWRASLNVSWLRFAETGGLEPFANQNDIAADLGIEVTFGAAYRPVLTNNLQVAGGLSVFFPGSGFQDLYESDQTLVSAFLQVTLVY